MILIPPATVPRNTNVGPDTVAGDEVADALVTVAASRLISTASPATAPHRYVFLSRICTTNAPSRDRQCALDLEVSAVSALDDPPLAQGAIMAFLTSVNRWPSRSRDGLAPQYPSGRNDAHHPLRGSFAQDAPKLGRDAQGPTALPAEGGPG